MVQACLNFSVETDLKKLVQNLLWVVIQYAGASRGTLILRKDQTGEEWDEALSVSTDPHFLHDLPHSSATRDSSTIPASNDHSEELNDYKASMKVGGKLGDLVPLSMLNYVASTRLMCVVNNMPSSDCMFSSDEYWRSLSPKAVLMLPVIHQVCFSFPSNSLTMILNIITEQGLGGTISREQTHWCHLYTCAAARAAYAGYTSCPVDRKRETPRQHHQLDYTIAAEKRGARDGNKRETTSGGEHASGEGGC